MARKVTFVEPTTASDGIPLDEIPAEVKAEAEQFYTQCKTSKGRVHIEFDTKAELLEYTSQIASYCSKRPEGKIRFRKSPTRDKNDTVMDFRITDFDAEENTEKKSTTKQK